MMVYEWSWFPLSGPELWTGVDAVQESITISSLLPFPIIDFFMGGLAARVAHSTAVDTVETNLNELTGQAKQYG